MAACHRCGGELTVTPPVGRSEECPSCSAPVRCCLNCVFYQPGAHWDCRETISEAVLDKERANFCDWFRLNTRAGGSGTPGASGTPSARDRARNSFDALFG